MARAWLAACACCVAACSRTDTRLMPLDEFAGPLAEARFETSAGRELIPAEWTVAEDTSSTGEVTTVSLQLPNVRDIGGLLNEDVPQLILRCLDGKVQVFIDTESAPREGDPLVSDSHSVQVELDSAPSCE